MFDLDGVVYVGDEAVPHAATTVARLRADDVGVAFITNNASRTPLAVSEHLIRLGVGAAPEDVVTSAQAAARMLVQLHGAGARVVAVGGDGVRAALTEVGLHPVDVDAEAVAVLTGYGPEVLWRDLMTVAVRIREGLSWVASNTDHTIPTPRGSAPGHGVLVEMLSRFTGVTAPVAGKPERPLLDETIRRVGGTRPLMIGDRLDTDIEGGHRAGIDSLLVLTGVTGAAELVAARPDQRPTFLSGDLRGLYRAHPEPTRASRLVAGRSVTGWSVGESWAGMDGERPVLLPSANPGTGGDAWRALAAAAWEHLDRTGTPADVAELELPPPDDADR